MTNYIYINQNLLPEEKALVSVKQRAFRYGDGIFETCKIIDGIIYDYQAHESRIKNGLKTLQISANINSLKKQSYQLIKKNKIDNGILRISISRGEGSMGYLPNPKIESLLVIETIAEKKVKSEKIKIGISKIKTLKRERNLQKSKTMQALNYVLAKIAAHESGHFDDVMLNQENYISECSSSNIFWIKNKKLYTSSIDCDALLGTIRQKIINKFPLKTSLVKAKISALKNADEVFLTNSNLLVLSVDELFVEDQTIKYKKEITKTVLEFIQNDIKNYVTKEKDKLD